MCIKCFIILHSIFSLGDEINTIFCDTHNIFLLYITEKNRYLVKTISITVEVIVIVCYL